MPVTELYAFQLLREDSITWHIHSPQYLSKWNPGGYTNQPEWLDNNSILVSARKQGEDQNDIYRLDLSTASLTRYTRTIESEYSPLRRPSEPDFSCVLQMTGDSVDQQVYVYALDLSSSGRPLLTGVKNVGYYCWLDTESLGLFLVTDPPKMALMSVGDKTPRVYSSGIGRCLRRSPGGMLAYVHKYSETFWYLKEMDPDTKRSEIIVETLPGSEDFAIDNEGVYFMGSGSVLYAYDPALGDGQWSKIADLGIYGISNITRLSVSSSGRIAIVNRKGE